jgi:ABC-type spermidine/putrescine transport system permease subunit I
MDLVVGGVKSGDVFAGEELRRRVWPFGTRRADWIAAGMSLVFILSYTAFTIPTLMGGASLQIVSVYIWNNVRLLTWSTAAAFASLLLITSLAVIVSLNVLSRRLARWQHLSG